MIQSINDGQAETTGCSCCAGVLDLDTEQDEVLAELKENLEVINEVLDYYGIDFQDFIAGG